MDEVTTLRDLLDRYGYEDIPVHEDAPVVVLYVPIEDIRRCVACGGTIRNQSALALDGAGREVYDDIQCLVDDLTDY